MIDPILTVTRQNMQKALDVTRQDISSVRSGRATPALVENMVVSVYAGTQRLKLMELATITAQDAKTILISPFDVSITSEIAKGIQVANSGLTPSVDGEAIRISLPPLSEERRKEYIKLVGAKLEAGRIMVRQVRHESLRDVKRLLDEKQITEDQNKSAEKKIQELTDDMVQEIDEIGRKKEEELLQI